MTSLRRLIRWLNGQPNETYQFRLERRLIVVRWIGIVVVAPGLLLAGLSPDQLIAAYGVLAFAFSYNWLVVWFIDHRPGWLANGYPLVIGDALANVLMIKVTGGLDTPFYFLVFSMVTSVAMRYGFVPGMLAVAIVVGMDVQEQVARLGPGLLTKIEFLLRSGSLLGTTVLAGCLSEQHTATERALRREIDTAAEIDRAAQRLARALGLEELLSAIASEVGTMFQAGHASARMLASGPALQVLQVGIEKAARPKVQPAAVGDASRNGGPPDVDAAAEDGCLKLLLRIRGAQLAEVRLGAPQRSWEEVSATALFKASMHRASIAIENALLYRVLHERTHDLERAYVRLAAAHQQLLALDASKTEFVVHASDELRVPLTSLRSFSELILLYEDEPSVHEEFLNIIHQESQRLSSLVNDLLDLAKLEAGRMEWHWESIQIGALLPTATSQAADNARAKGVEFGLHIAEDIPPITADPAQVSRAISRLAVNAVRFTAQGSVEVRARPSQTGVEITIQDSGPGIPKEQLGEIARLFAGQRYYSTASGSIGLGLSLCRAIVSHLGGSLSMASQVGVGARVTVELPLVAAPATGELEDLPAGLGAIPGTSRARDNGPRPASYHDNRSANGHAPSAAALKVHSASEA